MGRQRKAADIATIDARREALRAELAQLDDQARAAQEAARDAGRPVILAALERVKVAAMGKSEARAIAIAIELHGGGVVAAHLATMPSA